MISTNLNLTGGRVEYWETMRGSRKFCQRGSISDNVFFLFLFLFFFKLMGGRRGDPNKTKHYKRAIMGPPAKRNLNGVSLADGTTLMLLIRAWRRCLNLYIPICRIRI